MASDATTAEAPMTRRDLEAKIVALAWKDDEFRKKFLADPKAQFEEKLGTKLPASLRITAHEENENSLHFVIPTKPLEKPIEELSDEDLEKIAGGTLPSLIAVSIVGTAAMTALLAVGTVMSVRDGARDWK